MDVGFSSQTIRATMTQHRDRSPPGHRYDVCCTLKPDASGSAIDALEHSSSHVEHDQLGISIFTAIQLGNWRSGALHGC